MPENGYHGGCPGGTETESGEDGVDSGPTWTPASGLHHYKVLGPEGEGPGSQVDGLLLGGCGRAELPGMEEGEPGRAPPGAQCLPCWWELVGAGGVSHLGWALGWAQEWTALWA